MTGRKIGSVTYHASEMPTLGKEIPGGYWYKPLALTGRPDIDQHEINSAVASALHFFAEKGILPRTHAEVRSLAGCSQNILGVLAGTELRRGLALEATLVKVQGGALLPGVRVISVDPHTGEDGPTYECEDPNNPSRIWSGRISSPQGSLRSKLNVTDLSGPWGPGV